LDAPQQIPTANDNPTSELAPFKRMKRIAAFDRRHPELLPYCPGIDRSLRKPRNLRKPFRRDCRPRETASTLACPSSSEDAENTPKPTMSVRKARYEAKGPRDLAASHRTDVFKTGSETPCCSQHSYGPTATGITIGTSRACLSDPRPDSVRRGLRARCGFGACAEFERSLSFAKISREPLAPSITGE